jgi:hypothetical protein
MNFFTLDKDWCFTFVNINDSSHVNRAVPGRNIWDEYIEIVETPFHEACLKAMKDQQALRIEVFYSSDESWWEKHIYPHVSGIAVYFINITERKKIEEQFKARQAILMEDLRIALAKLEKRSDENIKEGFEQILKNLRPGSKENAKLALPTAEGLTFIKVMDILYCKASGNYTEIFLKDGKKYLVSRQLKEYEELLSEHNFFRIHHSSLVHLDYIQNYIKGDGGYVIMSDNALLDVSRRKKDSFLERLSYKL